MGVCAIRCAAVLAALLAVAWVVPASADIYSGLENGLGLNAEPIGASIFGLVFSTTSGGDVLFADINSGWYSAASDNGKLFGDGEYFVSADVCGYVPNLSDVAKMEFAFGPAGRVKLGYSSQFPFFLNAYDASGSLLATADAPANVRSQGGAGLAFAEVTATDIAYVTFGSSGAGGYWLVDNIETDAPIPEPASLIALAAGLVGILGRRRTQRSTRAGTA